MYEAQPLRHKRGAPPSGEVASELPIHHTPDLDRRGNGLRLRCESAQTYRMRSNVRDAAAVRHATAPPDATASVIFFASTLRNAIAAIVEPSIARLAQATPGPRSTVRCPRNARRGVTKRFHRNVARRVRLAGDF
jgi:hypothetical protein